MNKMKEVPFLKLILIGDIAVGKTSIIKRFVYDSFDPYEVKPTLEPDAETIYLSINGCKLVLKITDTAGMERFDSVTNSFYHLTHGVLVVYNVTDMKSFLSVSSWLNRVKQHCEEADVLIVGNKKDELVGNTVNVRTVEKLAELENYEFIETSALDGSNIKEAFDRLLRMIILRAGIVKEGEEVDIRVLPRPSPSEMAELDMLDEQLDKKRVYKRALEKLIEKQIASNDEKVVLTAKDDPAEGQKQGFFSRCCNW